MSMLDRSTLMKAHALLAAFILPVAIMFLVTGGLYTWGFKGSYAAESHELRLQEPMQDKLDELVALAATGLAERDMQPPTGKAKIKRMGDSYMLEWTGSNRDVVLEPTANPLIAKLEVKDTSWYRQFVQLHKAKGGESFKVYAAIFASALLLLLVSGAIMAWKTPKLRVATMLSAALGVAAFFVMVLVS